MVTIKKKIQNANVPGVEAATTVSRPLPPPAPAAAVVPAAPPGLEPAAAAPAAGGAAASSYKVFAILAVGLTLCVLAVIVLQYLEYASYQAAPSVWLAK